MSRFLNALESAGVSVKAIGGGRARLNRLHVGGVRQDSREVKLGDLFVTWAGGAHDGHEYVAQAGRAGAVAAIVERPVPEAALPQIQVDNARLAAAVASDFAAGSPWRKLRTVGVTGTNGKTTTTLLLQGLLQREGPAAAIGTLGVLGPEGRVGPDTGSLTTPGPVRLSGLLSSLARSGVTSVVMEASSHALHQYRLDGVRFDVTAFTNLSRDHLDYHGSRERYLAAKARLLELPKNGGWAVINADDPAWRALQPSGPVVRYGLGPSGDLRARNIRLSSEGSRFDLEWEGVRIPVAFPLPGEFNIGNALCAAACALALGQPLEDVARGLGDATPVPGRMERIADDPFDVLIDFAHTPDALEQALKALRALVAGRLIVVFGAGGDRDPAKRPRMGAAVSRYADTAVVTSDNPRTEDPGSIVSQVAAGVEGGKAVEIVDRRTAIHQALDWAEPGDMVVLSGKGHETCQVVGTERQPFDERRIVLEYLSKGRAS